MGFGVTPRGRSRPTPRRRQPLALACTHLTARCGDAVSPSISAAIPMPDPQPTTRTLTSGRASRYDSAHACSKLIMVSDPVTCRAATGARRPVGDDAGVPHAAAANVQIPIRRRIAPRVTLRIARPCRNSSQSPCPPATTVRSGATATRAGIAVIGGFPPAQSSAREAARGSRWCVIASLCW